MKTTLPRTCALSAAGVLRELVDAADELEAREPLAVAPAAAHAPPADLPVRTVLRALEVAQPYAPVDDVLTPLAMWRGLGQP
eukprot:CAMPEP_0174868984 /NCGR_PEP_ID=MMETSP1114-20130205/67042_1 /TAXON_ID=312471 /ORGANISM="Neobodo designis, Strain CCAP 1951/1" /LENGTH=81 /DNA_ID=CAMNT_0016104215 /DNA_START=36 /DNA_END=278 /DNA_ORIENTATION=+